jgi:hypothetical protein
VDVVSPPHGIDLYIPFDSETVVTTQAQEQNLFYAFGDESLTTPRMRTLR